MSYSRVASERYSANEETNGPKSDSLRLAFSLVGVLTLVVTGAVLAVLLLSNRGALPTPQPFQFTTNATLVNAVYTQIETTLPPFAMSSTGYTFNTALSSSSSSSSSMTSSQMLSTAETLSSTESQLDSNSTTTPT